MSGRGIAGSVGLRRAARRIIALMMMAFVMEPVVVAGEVRQDERARVQPILFLPADEPFSSDRLKLQVEAVRDVQAWYAARLGGVSFYAEPLVVQRSSHAFAELAGNDFQNWWPLPAAEFDAWGQPWNDSSTVKLLILAQGAGAWAGADSENGGILTESEAGVSQAGHLGGLAVIGDSSIGGVLAGVCPRSGQATWRRPETGTAWWCNWNTYRGTVAHELGHTFALPHPDAFRPGFRCDSIVITNMQCHWAWPADSLLPFEAAHLRSLPVFGSDALDAWRAAAPDSVRNGDRIVFDESGDLLWLAGRGGGTGYLWGASLRGETGAATQFTAPPDARFFVFELGWARGAAPTATASLSILTPASDIAVALEPDAPPRTVRLPAGGAAIRILRLDSGRNADVGIAHPRWEMHVR